MRGDLKQKRRVTDIEHTLQEADDLAAAQERERQAEQQKKREADAAEAARKAEADALVAALAYEARLASAINPVYQQHREAHPGPLYGSRAEEVSLATAAERSDPEGLVPSPIRVTCAWLLNTPGVLASEGLFRIPGSARRCKELIAMFNEDPNAVLEPTEPVNNVCSLLVKYLLGLGRTPVFGATKEQADGFIRKIVELNRASGIEPIPAQELRELVMAMDPPNRATMRTIAHMLHEACKEEWTGTSKMDHLKFAMCVCPIIQAGLSVMIKEYHEVFREEQVVSH